ncbi:hypothetical protein Tco_0104604 [Tanacetum coccineum]
MIGTRPLLHNKTQDKQALKFKDQSHKRDLNERSKIQSPKRDYHPLGGRKWLDLNLSPYMESFTLIAKNEKRVMRHAEIHKFCDGTLRRTLEGLKSYYNDVKYGYVQKELTNDEVEFLKLFEEEIEVRLNYRDQMRRWEMYVNERPLGPRREFPE